MKLTINLIDLEGYKEMGMIPRFIEYTTSGIRIHPYKKGNAKSLEYTTSIWNPSWHKRNEFTGFFNTQDHTFVTHLHDSKYLLSQLPDYEIKVMKPNSYRAIDSFELKENLLDQNDPRTNIRFDIINQIMKKKANRYFINLQTGYGKTAISLYYISMLRRKALILCYATKVLNQYVSTVKNSTTMDETRLKIISSSEYLKKIYDGEEKVDPDAYDIYLCTPTLIRSYGERYGWDTLNDIMIKLGIGIKIIDEAHRNIKSVIYIDSYTNIDQTIYMSADYYQAGEEKRNLYFKIFYNVPIIKPDKEYMDTLKYICGVVVEYNTHPSLLERESIKNRYGFSNFEYMKYQFSKPEMLSNLESVLNQIEKINGKGEQTYRILILLSLIDQVDMVTDLLKERFGNQYLIGRYHSKMEDEEKEETLDNAEIIVSTVQSFGVGIDAKNIRYVIALDQLNELEDNQAAGRARPLGDKIDSFYFMFVDNGFPYCTRKIQRRLNYLRYHKIKMVYKITY